MAYLSHAGQATDVTQREKLDFIVSMTNLTWPAVAAISGGFQTLTGVGMRTSQQLNANFTQAQAGIMAAGGVASLALFDMTQKAMQFNREMSLVRGLIGDISNREMAQLSGMAKKLAVDFGEAPAEIAKGFQMIARAGIGNSAEQVKVLTNGMRLAKIEGMDVADAVKEVITATTLFGDSYQNVERYASAIAHAANISVTSAKQIGEALKYVGGGAKEHWSIEETLGAIATLSQKGVEGSTSGIAIRSFMVYILREMPKSQKALKQIGLTFDDFWEKVNGKRVRLKPFQDIIKMMSEAMYSRGMGRGDMMRVLAQFGEPRMMQQYIKLFPSQEELQNGTWLLAQFNSEMQKTYDMQSRLQNVLNSTQEKWNQMMSGIQVAEISIAEGTLPVISAVTDAVKGLAVTVGNSKILSAGLATMLTSVAAAGAILVAAWGKGAVGYMFAEAGTKIKNALGGLAGTMRSVNRATKESSFSIMAKEMEKLEKQAKNVDGTFKKLNSGDKIPKYNAPAETEKIMGQYGLQMTPSMQAQMTRGILADREKLHEKGGITQGIDTFTAYRNAEMFLAQGRSDSPIYKKNKDLLETRRSLGEADRLQKEAWDHGYNSGRQKMEAFKVSNPEHDATKAYLGYGLLAKDLKLTGTKQDLIHSKIMGMDDIDIQNNLSARSRIAARAWQNLFKMENPGDEEMQLQGMLANMGKYHANKLRKDNLKIQYGRETEEYGELYKQLKSDVGKTPAEKMGPQGVKSQISELQNELMNLSAHKAGLESLLSEKDLGLLLGSKTLNEKKTFLKDRNIKGEAFKQLMRMPVDVSPSEATTLATQTVEAELEKISNARLATIKWMSELEESQTRDSRFIYSFTDKVKNYLNKWGKVQELPKMGWTKDLSIHTVSARLNKLYQDRFTSADAFFKPITTQIGTKYGSAYGTKLEKELGKRDKVVAKAKEHFSSLSKQREQIYYQADIFAQQTERLAKTLEQIEATSSVGVEKKIKQMDTVKQGANTRISGLKRKIRRYESGVAFRGKGGMASQNELDKYYRLKDFKSDKVDFLKDVQENREYFFKQFMEDTEMGNIEAMARKRVEQYLDIHGDKFSAKHEEIYDRKVDKLNKEKEERIAKVNATDYPESLKKDEIANIESQIANREKWARKAYDKISVRQGLARERMIDNLMRTFKRNRKRFEGKSGLAEAVTDDEMLEDFVKNTPFDDKYDKWDDIKQKPIPKEYKTLGDAQKEARKREERFDERYSGDRWTRLKNRRTANSQIKKLKAQIAQEERSVDQADDEINQAKKTLESLEKKKNNIKKRLEQSEIQQKEYEDLAKGFDHDIAVAERQVNIAKNKKKQIKAKLEKLKKDTKISDVPFLIRDYLSAQYDNITEGEKIQNTFGKRLPEGFFSRAKQRLAETLNLKEREIKLEEETSKKKTTAQLREDAAARREATQSSLRFKLMKAKASLFGRTSGLYKGDHYPELSQKGFFPTASKRIGAGKDRSIDLLFGTQSRMGSSLKQFISLDFLKDFKTNLLPNIPLLGTLASALGVSVGAIPVFGAAIAIAAVAIAGLAMWWTRWNQQMEIATKKLETYKKQATSLETREDQAINKLKNAKTPEEKAAFKKDLGDTRSDLSVVYDRMAGLNRQVYKLRSENWMQYSPIMRKEQGPSWYGGNIWDKATKALNPASWASGEMIARVTGAEKPTANAWLTGPREQMLAEAYQIEGQRSKRIQSLDSSQEGQIAMLEKQLKGGKIDKATFDKQTAKAYAEYAEKRTKLDRGFDRQLAPIVGSSNVEATKKLYQAEEQAKAQRLLLANAAFKLIGALLSLASAVMLPFRLLFGGNQDPYAPTDEEGQMPGEENISNSIESMATEMQNSIEKIEEVKNEINDMANGMLYEMYKANYTIDFIRGLLDYMTNPSKWIDPSVKAPRGDAETYETWVQKNKLGMEHRTAYYPGGETKLRDEERKKKLASGDIDPATLLAKGEITPEQARKIHEMNREKAAKAAKGLDKTLGMKSPTDKDGGQTTSFMQDVPLLGDIFKTPEPVSTPGAGLPAQKVDTGIGGSGPEHNDIIGSPQLAGTTNQTDEETPGIKPSEASSQLAGGAATAASMYLPPGVDILGGVLKDRTTSSNIPDSMTQVPDIGGASFAPQETPIPGDVAPKEMPLPPFGTSDAPGKFQKKQKEQKESLIDTLGRIFKTIADATGITWLTGKIMGMLMPEKKTPEEQAEQQKTHLRFQSPIKIMKGFAGAIGAGAQSLIFPQLDPDKFKNNAIQTGKDLFKIFFGGKAKGKGKDGITIEADGGNKTDQLLNQILRELKQQNKGRIEKAKDSVQGGAASTSEALGGMRDRARETSTHSKVHGAIYGTQGVATYKGSPVTMPGGGYGTTNVGGIFGQGGLKDKIQTKAGMPPGVRRRAGEFVQGEKDRAVDFSKRFATDKHFRTDSIFGKKMATPTGQNIPGRWGGILGQGGLKEKTDTKILEAGESAKQKAALAKDTIFGKASPDGKLGKYGGRRQGGLFGEGGHFESIKGKVPQGLKDKIPQGLKDKLPSGLSDKIADKMTLPNIGNMGTAWKRKFTLGGTKTGKQLIDGGQDIGKSLAGLGKGLEGKTQGVFSALGSKAFGARKIPGISNARAAGLERKISGIGRMGGIFGKAGNKAGEGVAKTLGKSGDKLMDASLAMGNFPGKTKDGIKSAVSGIGEKISGLNVGNKLQGYAGKMNEGLGSKVKGMAKKAAGKEDLGGLYKKGARPNDSVDVVDLTGQSEGNTVSDTANNIADMAQDILGAKKPKAGGKATKAGGKGAGKATKAGGKAGKTAGKAGKTAGKAGKTAGKAGKAGGKAGKMAGKAGKMAGKAGKAGGKAATKAATKVGGKAAGKAVGKGLKSVAKKIPFLGSLVAGADLLGGALTGSLTMGDIVSNAAALIPGVGTVGSIVGDVAGMGIDAATGGATIGDAAGVLGNNGAAAAAAGGGSSIPVAGAKAAGKGIGDLLNPLEGILSETKGQRKDGKKQSKNLLGALPGPLGIGGTIMDMFGMGGKSGGEKYRFKKHSPFTVWRGTSGTLPGSGGSMAIRFPELDSEKFKKEAIEAGEKAGRGSGNGINIIFQEGSIQLTSANADELEEQMAEILKRAVRRARVEQ